MTYVATMSARRLSGAGRAMGDVAEARGPYAALLEQVNRFTSQGKYGTTTWPLASGTLPDLAATTAALIYQARLLVALAQITDAGTASQVAAVSAVIKQGAAATRTWIAANQAKVTATLSDYANSLGLPAWPPTTSMFSTLTPVTIALGVGGLIAIWAFATGRV